MRSRPRNRQAVGALVAGLRGATARPVLVTGLWSVHLVLGFAVALPVFRWLYDMTAYRPAADVIATGFSFGWLAELLQFDRTSILGILQASVAGGLLVAVIVSPLLMAVTLASLRDGAARRGELGSVAVALYWPFLRVIVVGRALALLAGAVAATVLRLALERLRESSWAAGWLWASALQAAGAVLVAVLLLAAVDYALVHLESHRSRAGFRAWMAGVRFALGRPVLTLSIWAGAGGVLALAILVFIGLRAVTARGGETAPTGVLVGVAFLLQQAFMIMRTWLRVGLLGAEQHAFIAARGAVVATAPAPETGDTSTEDPTAPVETGIEQSVEETP